VVLHLGYWLQAQNNSPFFRAIPAETLADGRATFVSFSSVFFDVAEATLPSARFCFPLRAACTIWSWLRDRRSMTGRRK
jgi:hypothetical protein